MKMFRIKISFESELQKKLKDVFGIDWFFIINTVKTFWLHAIDHKHKKY
ncbi:hypothetical protein [Chryseobacterium balustinum]|nr:hypothetical protein [Chryseobacterium balustinum]